MSHPSARVGIVGGGQLARMLAQAAIPLSVSCHVFTDDVDALALVPSDGRELVVEPQLLLEREIAVQVARRPTGDVVVYPVVETLQRDGMCREVIAPAPITPTLAAEADRLARDLAHAIALEGVLAIELFVVGGALVVN